MHKLLAVTVLASGLLGLTGCGTYYNRGYARGGYYQTQPTYYAQPVYTQTTYVAPAPTVYAQPAPTYYAPTYVQTPVYAPGASIRGSLHVAIP